MKLTMAKNILVTGGCGFIGSHFVQLAKKHFQRVVVLDKITYAAINSPTQLSTSNYCCVNDVEYYKGDICNTELVRVILDSCKIDIVVNFAAETRVDRSIAGCDDFIQTNVIGVKSLLDACRSSWSDALACKRFIQVSTDEVFGSLALHEDSFTEQSSYDPRNPYAASKAAGDHLVMSYVNTHNFPAIITHCCNNYGLYQHPEKFIPKSTLNCLNGVPITIYGDGTNVREWIHAEDHCSGILAAILHGKIGNHYNFGTGDEMSNTNLAEFIRHTLNKPSHPIEYIEDRKGHDLRYSVNSSKARDELKWQPVHTFKTSLQEVLETALKQHNQIDERHNLSWR